MKIVVTGAAGFIGSHWAEKLAREGHEVVGIDNFNDYYDPALKERNAAEVTAAGARIERLDLAEADLSAVLAGTGFIYHLAAQPGISATTSFETYMRNNLIATHRLLLAAQAVPSLQCFVNIATSSVYGRQATDSEDTPPKPTSYYGVTKLAAEQLVLAKQREEGFPGCSLRIFSVYGPRERPDKLYTKLINNILTDTPFPLFEDSEHHSRSFTYVGDIMAGFSAVLRQPDRAIGEIFNIGSDSEITTGEGIAIVEDIIGKKAIIQRVPKRPGDQLQTRANIAKARRVLGYEPRTTMRQGLARHVTWCRERLTEN
jgi:nucleoside-diphosphate-sugar epimerase